MLSFDFLTDEQLAELGQVDLLRDYLAQKCEAVAASNARMHDRHIANQRRLTNIGTFRAYALGYLQYRGDIHESMTCMVRLLEDSATGIPIEIYCFTKTTAWIEYERIQGDIFDHLIAILPLFGLRLFQNPAGADFRALRGAIAMRQAG
jgi:miniconductance mechanosensitive channel